MGYNEQDAVQKSNTVHHFDVARRSLQRDQLLAVAFQRERQEPLAGRYLVVIVEGGYEGENKHGGDEKAGKKKNLGLEEPTRGGLLSVEREKIFSKSSNIQKRLVTK